MAKLKLLFICTANINRSRTGEDLFKDSDKYEAKSAGVIFHREGGQEVTRELLDWADKVFVMDEERDFHLTRLATRFNILNKEVFVLNIPDIYARGNHELVALLKERLAKYGVIV